MITIIEYNAGNTTSVQNAVERLGFRSLVTSDKDLIQNSEKVIFPGVGEASSAMKFLRENDLDKLILSLKQPVLGICLGQQLLCETSEEGNVNTLGVFPVRVRKFPTTEIVPHMGWNSLTNLKGPLFQNIKPESDVYFVHSYYCEQSEFTIAETDYILNFSSALQKGNFYATQFHPEKSSDIGEKILSNFLNLR